MSKEEDLPIDTDKMMLQVQEFCGGTDFETEFERFAMEHKDVFMQSLQFSPEEGEHPLCFHEVYRKYLEKFEGMIEQFIQQVYRIPYTDGLSCVMQCS
jgi:hypothetical protein